MSNFALLRHANVFSQPPKNLVRANITCLLARPLEKYWINAFGDTRNHSHKLATSKALLNEKRMIRETDSVNIQALGKAALASIPFADDSLLDGCGPAEGLGLRRLEECMLRKNLNWSQVVGSKTFRNIVDEADVCPELVRNTSYYDAMTLRSLDLRRPAFLVGLF